MEFKDTKTFANLLSTFAGESMARNKYTFYSSVAKREGFEQIAGIFYETAENEREHAKRALKLAGMIGTTEDNLLDAIHGEHSEWSQIYKEFGEVAAMEGLTEVATFFQEISEVEEQHEKRYQKLYDRVQDGTVFSREEPIRWHCRNCGYIHEGTTPPEVCPACLHPRSYYEEYADNY